MEKNRNFGKLDESGNVEYAPLPLVIDGENFWTNEAETYMGQGFLPIIRTEKPIEEGFCFSEYFEEEEGSLVQKWKKHEAVDIFSGYELLDIITEGVKANENPDES